MSQENLPAFSKISQSIVPGSIYEHYKKKRYKVLGVARHSESLEELVVYQALYGELDIWVRPLALFIEDVLIDGILQPRFRLL
jgi:hypothetical protein